MLEWLQLQKAHWHWQPRTSFIKPHMAKLWKWSGVTSPMIWSENCTCLLAWGQLPHCRPTLSYCQSLLKYSGYTIHFQVVSLRLEHLDHLDHVSSWSLMLSIHPWCNSVNRGQHFGGVHFWLHELSDFTVKSERKYSLSPPLHSTTNYN